MKKSLYLSIFLISFFLSNSLAQRQMEKLDRGLVVVNKGSNQLFISWRFFATDNEDITFNLYRQAGNGTPVKLNDTPISGATNYVWTVTGTSLSIATKFSVKSVLNGVEGAVEGSWALAANQPAGYTVRDFLFQPAPAGYKKMSMKFCWPGDLDGDGQYDFVVDRHPGGVTDSETDTIVSTTMPVFVDAYKSDGTFKWRVNAGINVIIGSGQADMITTYDLDGDGKAEVCMAVSEGTTFPDGTVIKNADGTVHDYNSVTGSAPQWIAVLNGETGNLIDTVGLALFDEIKSDRSDKWKAIAGQFIIQYLDGIHPSLVYQYKTRKATGHFLGGTDTWRLINGKLVKNWAQRYHREDTEYESHQFRAADVDGDGKDELVQISYTIDDDGSLLNIVPNIAHGDRHCVADIDPDRPGLEHFFIQQTNILGMGINDAATGEIIKSNYLSAVADIGRGICASFDPTKRGMQYYSTMAGNAMYDSKGKLTSNTGSFPAEALWWGPGLSRYEADAAGSDKNPILEAYSTSAKSVGRAANLYKMDVSGSPKDYYIAAPNGGRAAFWGDMLGDWREELIYPRRDTLGFVILSTSDVTTHRQYCLMQNPAYRMQTTHRGYYQTADVDFYMAADMPEPPVAPVQTADVYLTTENTMAATAVNGKSVMLDIRNPNTNIALNEDVSLTRLWLMNPKGKNYTIAGAGKLTGAMDVVKSLQGDITINGNHNYTGKTRISEGWLFVNGSLISPVQVDARGVIGGNATLNGGITLETGLNVEGARLEPGNDATLGSITIAGDLVLPGRNNLAFDIDQTKTDVCDKISILGNFTVTGTNHTIIVKQHTAMTAGILTLITFSGTTNAIKNNFKVVGLEGIPFTLIFEQNALKIEITQPRTASVVNWQGANSSVWDFETKNFLNGTANDIFVPGDSVVFNDDAVNKILTINETMPVKGISVTNNTDYKISGDGKISGNGGIIKTGTGKLSLLTEENNFTGGIDFSNGVLEVSSLKDGGLPSSIGASSSDATNWILRNATLQTAGQMATLRNMNVIGKLIVNNPAANNSVMIGGNITGDNITLELTGAGALNLQGVNNFSSVTVKSGTLALGTLAANSKAVGTGVITLEGGTVQMRDANSMDNVGPWTNTIDVPEGKTASWNVPMRWNFTNKLTGKGTINIGIPYIRNEFKGDWSAFEGKINVVLKGDAGDFRINNDYSYPKASFDLSSNISLYHLTSGRTIKLGGLSGVATSKLTGTAAWNIGGNNVSDLVFAGVISGTGTSLTKEGTGSWTLSGANTFTGACVLKGGKLIVTNTTGSATGTNTVTVATGTTLAGTGSIAGNTSVASGGILAPGTTNAFGNLKFGGNLSLYSGSKTTIRVATSTNDKFTVTGTLVIRGTLELLTVGTTFTAGKSYTIFTAGTFAGGYESFIPATPGEGLKWNTTRMNEGIISVDVADGIGNIADETVKVYPSLVKNNCTVEFNNSDSQYQIAIIDKLGRTIQLITSAESQAHLNLQNVNSGIYFIKITNSKNQYFMHKIIKL